MEALTEYFLPISMLVVLVASIFTGYPAAFTLAGVGIVFAFIGGVPLSFLGTVVSRIYGGVLTNWLLLAAPLFIFMGLMLEKSGLAQNLLLTLERLFGRVRGGLALSVALLGIIMAASTGIVGASVVLLGVIGLPVMLRQGYNKELAAGVTAASGTLGILIPPSIMLVFMGAILQISVGDLFKAALTPGLLLGALYLLYILLVSAIRPEWAPASPDVSDGGNLLPRLLRDLLGPVFLIVAVLGSIMSGLATPTEAAGLGAMGGIALAAFARRLNLRVLREVLHETSKITAMVIFVLFGATCFSAVFKHLGGDLMIEEAVVGTGLGPYGLLMAVMALIFVLGFFLEWIEISFIVLPLFAPLIAGLDFGFEGGSEMVLVWFATLTAINMQTSFITPPFGYSLFYLRGVAPPELSIGIIYRSVIPFVVLQLICLLLAVVFPGLVLWLVRP